MSIAAVTAAVIIGKVFNLTNILSPTVSGFASEFEAIIRITSFELIIDFSNIRLSRCKPSHYKALTYDEHMHIPHWT